MLIRINCPNPQCKKQLRIDARHAGKKIACQGCKQHIRLPSAEELKLPVQAAAGATSGDTGGEEQIIDFDMLASEAAQGDKAAVEAELQTTMVEFTCPQCDEPVKVAAEHAGKRHPCPSCRRIIAIPKLDTGKPKDWREKEAQGPSLAKKEVVKLEGAWGNQEVARVSLEAMEEAKALPKVRKKLTGRDYARYSVMAIMLIAVLGVSWWGWNKFSSSNFESGTLAAVRQTLQEGKAPAEVNTVLRRGLGEWLLLTGTSPDIQRDGMAEFRKAISSAGDPSWTWVTAQDTASVIGQYVSLDPKQEKPIVDLPFLVDLIKSVKDEPREAVIRQLCRSVLTQPAGNPEKLALAQQLLTTVIKQASPPSNITAQAPTKTPGKTMPMNLMDYSEQMNGLGILAQELVNAGAKENALRLIGPNPQSGERAMYKPGMPVPKAFVAAMAMVTQVDWEVGKEAEGDLDLGKMIGLFRSNQDSAAAEIFRKRKEAGLAEMNLLPYLDTAEHAIDTKRLPEALSRLSEAMQIAQIYTTRRDADWKNRVYAHVRLCELTARAGQGTLAEERLTLLKLDEVPAAGQLARALVARNRAMKAGDAESLVKGLPANSAALTLAGYDLARLQGELEKNSRPSVVSAITEGVARQAASLGGLVGWKTGQPK
jgi:hypothetical protein